MQGSTEAVFSPLHFRHDTVLLGVNSGVCVCLRVCIQHVQAVVHPPALADDIGTFA